MLKEISFNTSSEYHSIEDGGALFITCSGAVSISSLQSIWMDIAFEGTNKTLTFYAKPSTDEMCVFTTNESWKTYKSQSIWRHSFLVTKSGSKVNVQSFDHYGASFSMTDNPDDDIKFRWIKITTSKINGGDVSEGPFTVAVFDGPAAASLAKFFMMDADGCRQISNQVADGKKVVSEAEKEVKDREEAVAKREKAAKEKEDKLTSTALEGSQKLEAKEKALTVREEEVKKKEDAVLKEENKNSEREKKISDGEKALEAKINEAKKRSEEKEKEFADRQKKIDATEEALKSQKLQVEKEEAAIKVREKQLAEREKAIDEKKASDPKPPPLQNIHPPDYEKLDLLNEMWPSAVASVLKKGQAVVRLKRMHRQIMDKWVADRGDNLVPASYDYLVYSHGVAWPKVVTESNSKENIALIYAELEKLASE